MAYVCAQPGCGELIPRSGRCAIHRPRKAPPSQRGLGRDHQRATREAIRLQDGHCYLCGDTARPGDPLTGDHLVPRSKGGTVEDGILAAHRSCNARKGAR